MVNIILGKRTHDAEDIYTLKIYSDDITKDHRYDIPKHKTLMVKVSAQELINFLKNRKEAQKK